MLNFFFQAEDGIRDWSVTGVQTCALPIPSELLSLWLLVDADELFVMVWPCEMRNLRYNRNGDRKSVVEGKSVDLGGRRIIKKKNNPDCNLMITCTYSC